MAQIIAESEKFLRLKVLPDESSSESEDSEEEELDANGNPKLKVPGFVNFRTNYFLRKKSRFTCLKSVFKKSLI